MLMNDIACDHDRESSTDDLSQQKHNNIHIHILFHIRERARERERQDVIYM